MPGTGRIGTTVLGRGDTVCNISSTACRMKGLHLKFRNSLIFVGAYLFLTVFLVGGSCDTTDVQGSATILLETNSTVRVGYPIRMQLQIDPKCNTRIYRIQWIVHPTNAGKVTFDKNTFSGKDTRTFTNDRFALFTPQKKGKANISVYGFYYPQTSPQRLVKTNLFIR